MSDSENGDEQALAHSFYDKNNRGGRGTISDSRNNLSLKRVSFIDDIGYSPDQFD